MEFNFSKDSEYHTQRNNEVIPLSSCNTTSMIMAMKQAGYAPPSPEGMQPEDYLTKFLLSESSFSRMKTMAPWTWNFETNKPRINPNEFHNMLEWGINTLMDKEVDRFSTDVKLTTIIATLLTRGGVVLSGNIPLSNKTIGHMVSLAGFVTDNEDYKVEPKHITHFIIDDPYGDFRTDYQDCRGNNIRITMQEFLDIFKDTKDTERKWAHIIQSSKCGDNL